jgi:hypothetical protein
MVLYLLHRITQLLVTIKILKTNLMAINYSNSESQIKKEVDDQELESIKNIKYLEVTMEEKNE